MWNCESVRVDDHENPTLAGQGVRVTIALIDRRALDRECLARGLLASQPNLDIQPFGSLDEWQDDVRRAEATSVVLFSIGSRSADEPDIETALDRLAQTHPGLPTILLADSENAGDVLLALDRGARGYIPSSVGLRIVIEVLNLVRAGGVYVPAGCLAASRAEILAPEVEEGPDPLDDLLTPRQAAVAEALRRGKANKIIAYELDLCESTVKVHIRAIMRKLGAHNRTEVAFKLNNLAVEARGAAANPIEQRRSASAPRVRAAPPELMERPRAPAAA